jgi:hypothetical protein
MLLIRSLIIYFLLMLFGDAYIRAHLLTCIDILLFIFSCIIIRYMFIVWQSLICSFILFKN